MAHRTKAVKIRMTPELHELLEYNVKKFGYTSISEFVRLSIREKIHSESNRLISDIAVDLDYGETEADN